MHTQEVSKLCAHTGGFRALCTHRRIPGSVHTQEDSGLCAHTGGFRALCTHRRIPGSVHKRVQALCTGKGSALCTQGLSSVHKRLQALCTKGSKLCAQAGVQLCAHAGGLLVKNRVFELSNCTSLISSGFYIFQTYSR